MIKKLEINKYAGEYYATDPEPKDCFLNRSTTRGPCPSLLIKDDGWVVNPIVAMIISTARCVCGCF